MSLDNFIETFSQLRQKLHRVACNILRDELEAEDAVQDAFCNLWSSRVPVTSEEARARLFAILRNVCLNKLKRKRYFEELSDSATSSETSEVDDSQRVLAILLSSLTPLQRQIFQMAAVDNMEYDVIADRLDMTVDAVRMNMSRARKKMRELYSKM